MTKGKRKRKKEESTIKNIRGNQKSIVVNS